MTTDVATYLVSGEPINNGSITVSYGRIGEISSTEFTYDNSFSYSDLETRYTNRFDDVAYFFTGSGHPWKSIF